MKSEKTTEDKGSRGSNQVSLINEIIKREKKFHAIYSTFTLNLKRCIINIIKNSKPKKLN